MTRTRDCKEHQDRLRCGARRDCRIPCSPGRLQRLPPRCPASQRPPTSSHCLQGAWQVVLSPHQPPTQPWSLWRARGHRAGLLPSRALTRAVPTRRGLRRVVNLRHGEIVCVLPARLAGSAMGAMQAAQPASHPAAPDPGDSPDHLSPSLQLRRSQGCSRGCSRFSWVLAGAPSLP